MPDLRRIETKCPAFAGQDKSKVTSQKWQVKNIRRSVWRLFQRPPGHRGQLARQAVGHMAGDGKLALALEALDGGAGFRIVSAARLDLAVTVIGERTLHGDDAPV